MDGFFFWLSKLIWLVIAPDSLVILWFALGVGLFWLGQTVWARRVLTSLAIVLVFIGLFPVGEWLFYPLETHYPANPKLEKIDGIIMLSGTEDIQGSQLWGQVLLGDAAERDLAFMYLARRFPEARLVFSGGSGSMLDTEFKAADVAQRLFSEQGLDVSRIIFERESRNTWENAIFSRKRVQPAPEETWVLITTGWHMPRSAGIFCKVGWTVIPYPVDFRSEPGRLLRVDWDFALHLVNLTTAVREWVGLAAYRLTGKSC